MRTLRTLVVTLSLGCVLLAGCESSGVCISSHQLGDLRVEACSYFAEGAQEICDSEGGELVAAEDRGEAEGICSARGLELTAQ